MRTIVPCVLAVVVSAAWHVQPARAEDLLERVGELSEKVAPEVVRLRRDFHAHPELSNREERTGRVVAERLRAIGIEQVATGVAHHGVVALIPGGKPGPTVALRADIDALPVQEATGLPFASENEGVMHACGHDAHTAMLLGAAEVLWQIRDTLPGTVKLIFQPAEEGVPLGEEGGARLMTELGVLKDPDVSAIFALHVNPDLPSGKLAYRLGGIMASVDRFDVTLTGKQSHGAMPWQGVDPVVATAHVITAIQSIASRKIDARQPVVVSVGVVRAEGRWNIIPEKVIFQGTIRTHNEEVRREAGAQFRRIVEGTASALGVSAEIEFSDYGPITFNDPDLGKRMLPTLVRAAGEGNVVETDPVMGGEDFALYAERVPGFYLFLGIGNEQVGAVHALHTPNMIVDEAALPLGVRTLVLLAVDYLNQAKP
jgi:amidohydrolase